MDRLPGGAERSVQLSINSTTTKKEEPSHQLVETERKTDKEKCRITTEIQAKGLVNQHQLVKPRAISSNGFSIDGLLGGGSSTEAPVDYFMEEEELSWTDGRRSRKLPNSGKGVTVKNAQKEKHPPLPSSSSLRSSAFGGAKHVCSECGKSYATSSNLSRHRQTHRPLDSPHAKKCSFCDRVYVSMPALSMHLLTHQARHKCHLCGKLFSRPWLLKGHLRSHTGQKPFGCGNCGKAFSDRSNLRAHLNTHSNDKRWRCGQCGRVFALRSYLSKHMDQQHGAVLDLEQKSGADLMMGTLLPSDVLH